MAANSNDLVPDEIIDQAAELFAQELDHWRLVEMESPKYHWLCSRDKHPQGFAIRNPEAPMDESIKIMRFTTKAHASMFLQWQGLRVVLNDENLRTRLAGLTPSDG